MPSKLGAVPQAQNIPFSESCNTTNQNNEREELHLQHLKNQTIMRKHPLRPGGGGAYPGSSGCFLRQRSKNNYRTLIESTFTVWPSIVPDTVAVALLLSGL